MDEKKVILNLEVKQLDENLKKTEKLIELIKEAKTLADELASTEFDINFKQQF